MTLISTFPDSSTEVALAWYAIQVKSREEKKIATLLEGKNIQTFLPTQKARRRWSDRYKEIEVALFPGYLFGRFEPQLRMPVLTTPSVLNIVGDGKTLIPVPEDQIEAVRRMTSSGQLVQPCPFLKLGQKVRIERGSLAGLEGILTRIRNTWRVVVSVDLIQQAAAVEVDRECLRIL